MEGNWGLTPIAPIADPDCTARGFRTASNFIAIAYLRMSRLKHLPINPLQPAMPHATGLAHRCL